MQASDLAEKLKQLDEISLMEILEISSEDLVERFTDKIEFKLTDLMCQFEEDEQEDDEWEQGY